MPIDLACPDCRKWHKAGETGISEDGKPTCLDCGAELVRGEIGV